MDIEHLKLILETVSSVSGDAAAIAISYIVFENILPFVGWMLFLFMVYKFGVMLINKIPNTDDESFFKEMRDTLRTGTSGALADHEKSATINKLKELAYKSKQ